MSAADDEADVDSVLAGNLDAFERIVHRWQRPMVNLAYRFCGDSGRAEEMAQEAFLGAYRGLQGWRKDATFSTWLFALATNLYRSEIRRIPPMTVSLDDIGNLNERRAIGSNPEDRFRENAVRKAVLALPPKYRDAVTLFYFHEMDLPAVAKSLHIPTGTLKARLFRGRELLRAKLQDWLDPVKEAQ